MLVGQLLPASLCLKSILCFSVFQSCVRFDLKKFLQTAGWNYFFAEICDFQYFHSDRLRCHAQNNKNTHTPVRVRAWLFDLKTWHVGILSCRISLLAHFADTGAGTAGAFFEARSQSLIRAIGRQVRIRPIRREMPDIAKSAKTKFLHCRDMCSLHREHLGCLKAGEIEDWLRIDWGLWVAFNNLN